MLPGISPGVLRKRYVWWGGREDYLQQDISFVEAGSCTGHSGTATLETALFRVPQAVCYHTPIGRLSLFLKRHVLKVKYISLNNLIANREVVKELVADTMTVEQVRSELNRILYDKEYRRQMLEGYEYMASRLGEAGAPKHAARKMVALLRRSREE